MPIYRVVTGTRKQSEQYDFENLEEAKKKFEELKKKVEEKKEGYVFLKEVGKVEPILNFVISA